jgi:outer membrane protein assembly factor BamB
MRLWAFPLSFLVFLISVVYPLGGGDWPQWKGPERDGLSTESGLLDRWPSGGPPEVWSITGLGEGYGTVAVHEDRIYVQGTRGRDSVVVSLGANDGGAIWSRAIGRRLDHNRGGGPRGTPTMDGYRLYALGENGDLACLRAADGNVLWQRNILRDFSGRNPTWLISESPLIEGDLVVVAPGGRGAGIVALDKNSGETVWTSRELNDQAGYSSAVAADIDGVRTILAFTAAAAVGVRASDGKLMWRYERAANRTANIATPVFADNKAFFTSAYGTGGALLGLNREGDEVTAEEIYFTRDMQNHHGGVVLVDDHLYGASGSILTCLDFATGREAWKHRGVGKASLTYADGHLYLLSENNVVGLAEATPEGYREKGRFTIPDQGRPSWAHPVVSGGRLYIRNQDTLTAYDIRAR